VTILVNVDRAWISCLVRGIGWEYNILVVHPNRGGRSPSKGLGNLTKLYEILSMVYKGTATPWDQGPRAVYKEVLFVGRTLY